MSDVSQMCKVGLVFGRSAFIHWLIAVLHNECLLGGVVLYDRFLRHFSSSLVFTFDVESLPVKPRSFGLFSLRTMVLTGCLL